MAQRKEHVPIGKLINLASKRALVTGGARGLGFAISLRLAEAGAAIYIADSDPEKAREAGEELTGLGYKAMSGQCDVSLESEVRDMVKNAVEKMGGIDILVNCAGIYPRIPLAEMKADDFEKVTAVNLKGTYLCCREVGQRMIEQGKGGSIINIASIDALHPSKGMVAYDASKGGVLMLTKSLALELGEHDIRVNVIAPGAIVTEGVSSTLRGLPGGPGRAQLKEFLSRMALGRMGRPDDIARVALFLASEMAGYMTGSLVVADGGYLIS